MLLKLKKNLRFATTRGQNRVVYEERLPEITSTKFINCNYILCLQRTERSFVHEKTWVLLLMNEKTVSSFGHLNDSFPL